MIGSDLPISAEWAAPIAIMLMIDNPFEWQWVEKSAELMEHWAEVTKELVREQNTGWPNVDLYKVL